MKPTTVIMNSSDTETESASSISTKSDICGTSKKPSNKRQKKLPIVAGGRKKLPNPTVIKKPLINSNICRFCGKFYASESELKEHEVNHTTNKELLCPQCGMGFARRSYLVEHACIHSGEKPHKCYYCDRPFALKCNLVRHVRIHTGEKPFVCDICKKDFTLKKNMIEHKRTHTGEKPFDCEICNLRFSRRSSLVRHLKIHTGEKCYECNECHKKFSWKYYLQRHMTIHLKNKCRKRRRRHNSQKKEEDAISHPIQPETSFVNCENQPQEDFVEHSYAMEGGSLDKCNFEIKEEFERTEDLGFKEEIHECEEKDGVPVESKPTLSKEQRQVAVVVTPVIISTHSKAGISLLTNQTKTTESQRSDIINFKMTANEFENFCGRRLHVKLHRLEEIIPPEMQVE